MSKKTFRSAVGITQSGTVAPLITHALFDRAYKESTASPIDGFMERLEVLNKLCPKPDDFNIYQGQLVLLGVVAAVESFLRTVLRRAIKLDPTAEATVHDQEVSYAAALHLNDELMPEAILERFSFISKRSIDSALRDLLAVKGELPSDLDAAIEGYVTICHMRHCAVHRFGKLGASNAIALGFGLHKDLLEKPLRLDYAALQSSIAIATAFVRTVNNFLFNELLSRVPQSSWTGNYTQDRSLFAGYYDLFADKRSTRKSAQAKSLYTEFHKQATAFSAAH